MFIVAWLQRRVARERLEVLVLEDQTLLEVKVESFEVDDRSTGQASRRLKTDLKKGRKLHRHSRRHEHYIHRC
jgi:hypothetical protein